VCTTRVTIKFISYRKDVPRLEQRVLIIKSAYFVSFDIKYGNI